MKQILYFIEDQATLNSYIVLARIEGTFPRWEIMRDQSIDETIEWCEDVEEEVNVVFVVDSRMPTKKLDIYLEKALEGEDVRREDIRPLLEDETQTLTGTLGTIVLKALRPNCRIILLTAYWRSIHELRGRHASINRLLERSINVSVSKATSGGDELTAVIKQQMAELQLEVGKRDREG